MARQSPIGWARTALFIAAALAARADQSAVAARATAGDGAAATAVRSAEPPAPDRLASIGFAATEGAAPGYVADHACAMCHRVLFQAYQEVGMAKSFHRPRPDAVIEDFAAGGFFHQPSQRHYEMVYRDGRYLFRRYQLDAAGEPINLLEQQVDWILGSGHHARTYLYRTPSGELYQLPVAWYSQERRWGMAPGYDRPDHDEVGRRVRRECMFCHNAYPEVPAGSDAYATPQVYPADLPEGTGCQRCHGPGAEHVRLALGSDGELEPIRTAIVNPARLPPARRDDVCYECHLQPSVALFGVRRFDRGDYSFRPGEDLADYLVHVDVVAADRPRAERFEINHHPYRLQQSRCHQASDGALSCLTCHDPHRKPAAAEAAAHYRKACLSCHRAKQCGRPAAPGGAEAHAGGGDCAACHMPRRRTQDVVGVVMTDHLIRRQAGGAELLAPLAESEPVIEEVELLAPERAPPAPFGEVYRAAALVRATLGADAGAVDRLAAMIAAARPPELAPYLDLAQGQLRQRRFELAAATLAGILERHPGQAVALDWLGIVRQQLGESEAATELFRRALAAQPERAESQFNLGLALLAAGRVDDARAELERATASRPNLAAAWYYRGLADEELGRFADAATALERCLAVEPSHSRAYLALGRVLLAAGQRAAALRYLRHGARVADRPQPIAEALAEAEASTPASPGVPSRR